MKLQRRFDAPWPAVLVEMRDFVELARLSVGGGYRRIGVRVRLSRSVPLASLTSGPVEEFRAWLEGIPRCERPERGFFSTHEASCHHIEIEIGN